MDGGSARFPRAEHVNFFRHIRRIDQDFVPSCIFDVGANVGQTIAQIRDAYPDVQVHAFEPVAATFATLEAATAEDPATRVHRLAMGAQPGKAVMSARPGGLVNRVLQGQSAKLPGPKETVDLVSGDRFCASEDIRDIGILKIDTEGHDLDVLVGFREMLADRRIHYVICECGLVARNDEHLPFSRLADFMFAMGYGVLCLMPADGRPRPRAHAGSGPHIVPPRYGNAVFVAEPWPD
jgi:FkbM family methyltransferase